MSHENLLDGDLLDFFGDAIFGKEASDLRDEYSIMDALIQNLDESTRLPKHVLSTNQAIGLQWYRMCKIFGFES